MTSASFTGEKKKVYNVANKSMCFLFDLCLCISHTDLDSTEINEVIATQLLSNPLYSVGGVYNDLVVHIKNELIKFKESKNVTTGVRINAERN